MPLVQGFDGQRRAEVPVVGSDQFKSVLPDTLVRAMVGRLATALVDQTATTVIPVPQQQPADLPNTQIQHRRCAGHGTSSA